METCLETARLILRPLQPDDWQAVLSYTADPAVMRYLPERLVMREPEGNADQLSCPDKFAINLKADGAFIGHLLFCHHDSEQLVREIGWVVSPQYQHHGYATEAAAALLCYGFETLGLQRVIAACDNRNHASLRVMEKLGMQREAHFQDCLFRQGEWIEEFVYAIRADEWRAEHKGERL
ncbi:MAG: GNAT family N-acetyltransferase [Chloroflexi bacterium]|nr:GNAT family N-acetyltransferase [Chloroflexota bacterium]